MKKLILDEMLKNTAILLRIFGVDTAYFHPRNDTELIETAVKEGRILVTRDREVYVRCISKNIPSVLVESTDPVEQIRHIISVTGIELTFPEKTRCSICNVELRKISQAEAYGHVPQDIIEKGGNFWICPSCNKAYWEGTHWKNIYYIYGKIMEKKE
ncbi:MAG: Mut7-C RNAse domain-containing protein [Candidatus Micrarchaeia archaeon]